MDKGQVLTKTEVAAEVARLCEDLRRARKASGRSGRDVGAYALVPQSTVWRIETGRTHPTYERFIMLTLAIDYLVDLDDGTGRPLVPTWLWPPNPEYRWRRSITTGTEDEPTNRDERQDEASPFRNRIGSELWWARYRDMPEPLSAEEVCRRLEMNHHTLSDVERGPGWPSLDSVVRVAGLTGRRLVINAREDGWRTPPWVPSTWLPTPSDDREPD